VPPAIGSMKLSSSIAVTMKKSPAMSDSAEQTEIWRYMDLPKFVSMLDSKELWFAKAARLEDAYEGFCEAEAMKMPINDPLSPSINRSDGENEPTVVTATQLRVELSGDSARYFQNAPDHLYVNSWCLSTESMAMWEIYGSNGRGVAIKSSVGRYKQAARLEDLKDQFAFGKVQYEDDPNSNPSLRFNLSEGSIPLPGRGIWKELLQIAFQKRTCFDYEKEWRGALYQDASEVPGCTIAFDLDHLISAIYVGPRADPFFFDVVKSLMKRFGLDKPLYRSNLLTRPKRAD